MKVVKDKLIYELKGHLIYIQLMSSLTRKGKGGIVDKTVKESIEGLNSFIKLIEAEDHPTIVANGMTLLDHTKKLIEPYKKQFPLKKDIHKIASEFDGLFKKEKPYSTGLEFGWLNNLMDCTKVYGELPSHARIGIGHHAGHASVEEKFLLEDAFFMLILAENTHKTMWNKRAEIKEKNPDEKIIKKLRIYNQNVCTYSRLGLLSFFSFIEAFVNGIGYDFKYKNEKTLGEKEKELLLGKKNNNYISLLNKIEKFPSIIRNDKKMPLILSDPNQIKEPFKTFFEELRLIRDSSVHFGPNKEKIWRKPDEWLDKVRQMSKICMKIANEFWDSCYPKREKPKYLNSLKYLETYNSVKERITV